MEFKVGGKLGYLNPNTGRYKWVKIVKISSDGTELEMNEKVRVAKFHYSHNLYVELINDVKIHMCTTSKDFSDKRRLIKYKGHR